MKKILMISALFAVSISLTFCSDNEDVATHSTAKEFQLKNLSSDGILFNYSSPNDFEANAKPALSDLIIGDNNYIKKTADVTDIVNVIQATDGVALVIEKHFIDTNDGLIKRSMILDPGTHKYYEINIDAPLTGAPVTIWNGSNCPQGSTYLGSCVGSGEEENTFAFNQCVGELSAQYALENAGLECSSTIQRNALFFASICAVPCSPN